MDDSQDDDSLMNDSSADLDKDFSGTNTQLFKIERKIQQGTDLSKRERRLLQNRKSALKCRLKKQQELDKMKKQVERLSSENRELKEKVGSGLTNHQIIIPLALSFTHYNLFRSVLYQLYFNAKLKRIQTCRRNLLTFKCSRP